MTPARKIAAGDVRAALRVLVCGGRDFTDYLRFAREMNIIRDEVGGFSVIIHGGAKGADWCAHLYANASGSRDADVSEWVFAANWYPNDGEGPLDRSAGPRRNARMLAEGKPDLVIAFPGGRGTADMIRKARAAGVEVREIAP